MTKQELDENYDEAVAELVNRRKWILPLAFLNLVFFGLAMRADSSMAWINALAVVAAIAVHWRLTYLINKIKELKRITDKMDAHEKLTSKERLTIAQIKYKHDERRDD
jgi:hypothetical protein